jgi:nitrogen fixation-related uncharacterized protein
MLIIASLILTCAIIVLLLYALWQEKYDNERSSLY